MRVLYNILKPTFKQESGLKYESGSEKKAISIAATIVKKLL